MTTRHIRRWTTPLSAWRTASAGCINSFHQVTSFPPKFTVAVNKPRTARPFGRQGFSVTCGAVRQEIIDLFGYKSGRVTDKFAGRAGRQQRQSIPEGRHMVSRIACKVVDQMEIGGFLLFVGQYRGQMLGDGRC